MICRADLPRSDAVGECRDAGIADRSFETTSLHGLVLLYGPPGARSIPWRAGV